MVRTLFSDATYWAWVYTDRFNLWLQSVVDVAYRWDLLEFPTDWLHPESQNLTVSCPELSFNTRAVTLLCGPCGTGIPGRWRQFFALRAPKACPKLFWRLSPAQSLILFPFLRESFWLLSPHWAGRLLSNLVHGSHTLYEWIQSLRLWAEHLLWQISLSTPPPCDFIFYLDQSWRSVLAQACFCPWPLDRFLWQ